MPEIARNRDVIVFQKGGCFTVSVDDTMAVRGWAGGMGVQYTSSAKDEMCVTFTDGSGSGFLLWGSDEIPDGFTSMTRNQIAYRFAVIGVGSWLIATSSFEKYTYASRTGGGPLVPLEYHASDRLVFSLRGLWTKEDEWALSGDPRGANAFYRGYVVQVPEASRNNYMTIQVTM